jgi:hypothetical protein
MCIVGVIERALTLLGGRRLATESQSIAMSTVAPRSKKRAGGKRRVHVEKHRDREERDAAAAEASDASSATAAAAPAHSSDRTDEFRAYLEAHRKANPSTHAGETEAQEWMRDRSARGLRLYVSAPLPSPSSVDSC